MKHAVIQGALLGAFLGVMFLLGNSGAAHEHQISVFPQLLMLGAFPVFIYPLLRRVRAGSRTFFRSWIAPGTAASAVAGLVLTFAVLPLGLRLHLGPGPMALILVFTFCITVLFGTVTAAAIGLILNHGASKSAPGIGPAGS